MARLRTPKRDLREGVKIVGVETASREAGQAQFHGGLQAADPLAVFLSDPESHLRKAK